MTEFEKRIKTEEAQVEQSAVNQFTVSHTEPDGQLLPTFFILVDRDGEWDRIALAVPFFGDEVKDMVASALRYAAEQHDILMIVMVSEAWQMVVPNGMPLPDVRPSQSPDRQEVLHLSFQSKCSRRLVTYAIERNESGIATLGERNEMDVDPRDERLGRFDDLVKPFDA
jgi:hypothetical protein